MKKSISLLLSLLLVLSLCAGCGDNTNAPASDAASPDAAPQAETSSIYATLTDIPMNETVLEMDGNAIPADIYLYYVVNMANSLEYQISMMNMYSGMYSELMDENGRVKWDQSIEGTPLVDMVSQQAENAALSYALMENVAAAHNITLTAEDQAKLDEELAAQVEQSGGQEAFDKNLYEMGLTTESFNRLRSTEPTYQHLLELAKDPSSDIYKAPTDNDAYVDHILLTTKDTSTNEPLSDEEIAEKKAKAEEILEKLQNTDELEQLFNDMADTYGEDPGRVEGKGYLIDPDTNFVQEFKDAAFALKPGEISGIVESDYGYHILLRKELTETHLETLADTHLGEYLDEQMAAAMENITRSEKLDSFDIGAFYTSYLDAMEALHPSEDQSADTASDGSGTADTGDTGGSAEGTEPESSDGAAE